MGASSSTVAFHPETNRIPVKINGQNFHVMRKDIRYLKRPERLFSKKTEKK
jgi:hypothetical protein